MVSKYSIMGFVFSIVTAFPTLQAEYDPFFALEQSLKEAIHKGNLSNMQYCISKGADVNQHEYMSQPHMGKTLLSHAINSNSLPAVTMLLQAGACVEDQSDLPAEIGIALQTRYLPHLSYAIAVGASLEIIKVLIQYSKDLNIHDNYKKRTPYEIAHHYNRTDVMAILEKAGVYRPRFIRNYLGDNRVFSQNQDGTIKGRYSLVLEREVNDKHCDCYRDFYVANEIGQRTVENTGLYWVIIKNVPKWWKLSKRSKMISLIAEYSGDNQSDIRANIKELYYWPLWLGLEFSNSWPILRTVDLKKAQELKTQLLQFDCQAEIHEIAFIFKNREDAEYFKEKGAPGYECYR